MGAPALNQWGRYGKSEIHVASAFTADENLRPQSMGALQTKFYEGSSDRSAP